MASPAPTSFPLNLLYAYFESRRSAAPNSHERTVAWLDELHLRRLQPLPNNFLASSRLHPSFPLHPVRFSNPLTPPWQETPASSSTPLTYPFPNSLYFTPIFMTAF